MSMAYCAFVLATAWHYVHLMKQSLMQVPSTLLHWKMVKVYKPQFFSWKFPSFANIKTDTSFTFLVNDDFHFHIYNFICLKKTDHMLI